MTTTPFVPPLIGEFRFKPIRRVAIAGRIGGTASVLGGGKFGNGSMTGAFAYAFSRGAEAIREARREGTIYVTGHRVGKAGPYHLAVEYSEDGNPHWISAGPEDGLLVSGQDLQRPTDAPPLNATIGEVQPPPGVRAGEYFSVLQRTDRLYCDCLDYDTFPGVTNGYNSNGYVPGLIQSTGGTTTFNFGRYVGGSKPVPAEYFGGP